MVNGSHCARGAAARSSREEERLLRRAGIVYSRPLGPWLIPGWELLPLPGTLLRLSEVHEESVRPFERGEAGVIMTE